jgi:hypothetical protein
VFQYLSEAAEAEAQPGKGVGEHALEEVETKLEAQTYQIVGFARYAVEEMDQELWVEA